MFISQSKEFSSKSREKNNLKYISTYKMGQIGITKLIEEPFKTFFISFKLYYNLLHFKKKIFKNGYRRKRERRGKKKRGRKKSKNSKKKL